MVTNLIESILRKLLGTKRFYQFFGCTFSHVETEWELGGEHLPLRQTIEIGLHSVSRTNVIYGDVYYKECPRCGEISDTKRVRTT